MPPFLSRVRDTLGVRQQLQGCFSARPAGRPGSASGYPSERAVPQIQQLQGQSRFNIYLTNSLAGTNLIPAFCSSGTASFKAAMVAGWGWQIAITPPFL